MRLALHVLTLALVLVTAACTPAPRAGMPVLDIAADVSRGRHAQSILTLSRDGPAEGQQIAYFNGADAGRITVSFVVQARSRMRAEAICDGRARVIDRPSDGPPQIRPWVPAGGPLWLELGPGERHRTWLELGTEVQGCDLTVTPGGHPGYRLSLVREETARPELAALDAPLPGCSGGSGRDPLERAFLASGTLSASCPVSVGAVRLLEDGIDALDARVAALTGRPVGRAALEAGDPAMELDWSDAPELDMIYLSYLNLNADFAGYLMARMIAWHAARGTVVRILVSDVMLSRTDRRLFEGLAARYPTVQFQPFRFPAEAARGLEGQLGRLHRLTHVKLFATVARGSGDALAIVGGRNLREGYFLDAPRDLSRWPFLHQYHPDGTRLACSFIAYEDFEIALQGAAARQISRNMAALWHRDHDSQAPRTALGAAGDAHTGDGMMRHFISIPYADGMAQEAWFISLIDAARQSISIAVPYLNLTPGLDAALRRARVRGVTVRVVSNLETNEVTALFVGGLNRAFVNAHGDWIDFHALPCDPVMLHAKLYVLDRRLAIVASTNLNQRSFVHDLENGVAILDRSVAHRIDAVIDAYVQSSRRETPGQHVPALVRWLQRVPILNRAF